MWQGRKRTPKSILLKHFARRISNGGSKRGKTPTKLVCRSRLVYVCGCVDRMKPATVSSTAEAAGEPSIAWIPQRGNAQDWGRPPRRRPANRRRQELDRTRP